MRCNAVVYFARGGHFYWNTGVNTAKECIGIKFVNREGGVSELFYFICKSGNRIPKDGEERLLRFAEIWNLIFMNFGINFIFINLEIRNPKRLAARLLSSREIWNSILI